MAAEIHFAIHDHRGAEILDELEQRTNVPPFLASETERRYPLMTGEADTSAFDAMLDRIDEDWRAHLSRTGTSRRPTPPEPPTPPKPV